MNNKAKKPEVKKEIKGKNTTTKLAKKATNTNYDRWADNGGAIGAPINRK